MFDRLLAPFRRASASAPAKRTGDAPAARPEGAPGARADARADVGAGADGDGVGVAVEPRTVDPDRLAAAFADAHGAPPAGVWHAPGRVNLMGEHTDYNDGLVLPMALPWGVMLALTPTDDGTVEVRSAQRPGEDVRFATADLDADSPTVTGWASYVAGVFWAAREAGHLPAEAGARIVLDSDLPIGAALSSSAALECVVLLALADAHGLTDLAADRPAMAAIARRAENAYVGAPTGILDQSASLRCTEGHALYLDCRTGLGSNVPFGLRESGLRLLIVDTKVEHQLKDATSGYAVRRGECERAAAELGVPALRDVEDLNAALPRLSDPVLADRVRHVVTEIHRVNAAVGLMRAGAVGDIGALFTASHLSMRDQFAISTPELDLAVETAVAAGARGARMTGGGFGGSAIALVPEDRLAEVERAVADAFAARGWTAPDQRVALPSPGARRLR
ncbi:galactokinase [Streptomonospora sp. S1-112]|uniref:Galactokinase n=1 Tax=Streptomonospora mangrovi TaxID=2883123 RepID=A0A9X3SJP8_9ACTN|nr:galactokinase [Streptomonospora mangrovi]MDA0567584.1 galactokinase [Streptomonospora mangrovi]